MELGGQALERWPPELFVPTKLATQALNHFLERGNSRTRRSNGSGSTASLVRPCGKGGPRDTRGNVPIPVKDDNC
jgi:hypothetical protein